MPTAVDEIAKRRECFESHLAQLREIGEESLLRRSRATCPCCGYPTLHDRGGFEICTLCFWEDDGQDDEDAGEVRGGPNHDYSLTEARANFAQHLTMYRPSDERPFKLETERKTLTYKRQLIKTYEQVASGVGDEAELWREARRLERKKDRAV